jgi:hypothetical protein
MDIVYKVENSSARSAYPTRHVGVDWKETEKHEQKGLCCLISKAGVIRDDGVYCWHRTPTEFRINIEGLSVLNMIARDRI